MSELLQDSIGMFVWAPQKDRRGHRTAPKFWTRSTNTSHIDTLRAGQSSWVFCSNYQVIRL